MIDSCSAMQMSKSLSKDNILNFRISDLGVFKRVKSIGQPKFLFFMSGKNFTEIIVKTNRI